MEYKIIHSEETMRLLSMLFIGANAMYRNELRHLPEKLRQERIQLTLAEMVKAQQYQIIQAASANRTEYSFTLFCLEPNIAQSGSTISLYQPYGDKYLLSPSNALGQLNSPILPRPRCEAKYGYELYQKWNQYTQFHRNYNQDRTRYNEMMVQASPFYVEDVNIGMKHIPIQPLEDSPVVYIQRFFELFNQVFPDIHLEVSTHRPSQGIFDQECCPVYKVSW